MSGPIEASGDHSAEDRIVESAFRYRLAVMAMAAVAPGGSR